MTSPEPLPAPVPSPPGGPAGATRWVLAPGLLVTRRGPTELQVGRDGHALVVPDRPGTGALLEGLAGAGATWQRGTHDAVWHRLLREELVVPAADLEEDVARAGDGGVPGAPGPRAAAVAAAYAALGRDAHGALGRRRSVSVGLAGDTAFTAPLGRLLEAAGVPVAPAATPEHAGVAMGDVAVWVVAGEACAADELVRRGVPHLLLWPAPRAAVGVGPFVAPGRTACSRCLAAARADRDPAAGVVDLQHARAAALPLGGRPATVPEPADPTLVALAAAWAARDVLTWAEGERPTTWSATVVVDHRLAVETTRWVPHPRCGCGWDREGPP